MKRTSIIETYLDGTLSAEEHAAFVKQMAEDPELAYQVQLHREVNEAISDNDVHFFRESVRSILRRKIPHERKLRLSWVKFPVAAGIVLLIAVSLWQIVFTKSPSELFTTYYSPYHSDMVTREGNSANAVNNLQRAYSLYQQKEFEASYQIIKEHFRTTGSLNKTAEFYLGMNAFELGLNDESIELLIQVEEDPSTPFSLHARWYLAMIYLKTGEPELAGKYLTILAASDNLYSERARSLVKKLKS